MRLKKYEKLKEMEEKARGFFRDNSQLNADQETKITLFLESVKGTNVVGLSHFQWTSVVKEEWPGYRFFHNQFYREWELTTLLHKGTRWSLNPLLYTQAGWLHSQFALQSQVYKFMLMGGGEPRIFMEYLALSHAVMTAISFLRLLPPDRPIVGPFWTAIQEIERNNEVQQQVQVRLMKDDKQEFLPLSFSQEEKEKIVYQYREIVEKYFSDFLEFLLTGLKLG